MLIGPGAIGVMTNRLGLLSWVHGAVTVHENLKLFRTGTLHPSTSSYETSSPLVSVKGQSVVLELIAEYCGKPTKAYGVHIHIFRQLLHLLPIFIEEVPFP